MMVYCNYRYTTILGNFKLTFRSLAFILDHINEILGTQFSVATAILDRDGGVVSGWIMIVLTQILSRLVSFMSCEELYN